MGSDRSFSDGETRRSPARSDEEFEDGPPQGLISRLLSLWQKPQPADEERAPPPTTRTLPRTRRDMIERVIAFDEKRVIDVMAPRADIVAVDVDTPLDALMRRFAEAGHSRMPVYRGELDDPIGMVHIKDVLRVVANPEEAKAMGDPILAKLRREILYVPPSMRITDLLLRMQISRVHMALVIDEFGGTDGLLTIEDLVEEIVGDINDEHDVEDVVAIVPRPGGWDVDARVELEEFSGVAGVRLARDDEEIDTLGGLVVSIAGKVPVRGEIVSHDESGLDFEIMEADDRKVRRLRIRRRPVATPAPSEQAI
ncbi:MAG: hemolysin family protein [Parvularculaceae bacterium]|nr:hemolysin family protein [Parvularculaceae bacterium]